MNERILADADVSEIVGEITRGPFSNTLMKRVLKHYGKKAFGRSSACMEFESFLLEIIAGPDRWDGNWDYHSATCLEIGTFHGITAILLSQYFDHVYCVSIDEMPVMKRELVDFLDIKNISFYDAKDNADKAAFVNALKFDFCYQDGDHTHDTLTDFDLVKRCGRVLFHEYWPLQPSVWNLVNSLPAAEVCRAQFDCLAYWEKQS